MLVRTTTFAFLAAVLMIAGCSGARQSTDPADALVGTWRYTVQTEEGDYDGTITFRKTGDDLAGTLTNALSPSASPLEDITYDGSALTFEFDGGQYGRISAEITVADDEMRGVLSVPAAGGDVPLNGARVQEG